MTVTQFANPNPNTIDQNTPISTSSLVAGASAVASLASLAAVIPQSTQPSSTKGYQPLAAIDPSTGLPSPTIAQPKALLFHYEGENVVQLESDITDHYIESNITIQDQIGLKPEIITVSGFIGELTNILPPSLQFLQTIASTLVNVAAYNPALSTAAQQQYNAAFYAYQSANSVAQSAVSAFSSIQQAIAPSSTQVSDSGVFFSGAQIVQNNQQQMFMQFYGYWYNRVLFNIQTPWAIFTNMAIKNLRAIQDESTRMITNFEVTFKKIRTAVTFSASNLANLVSTGRTSTQSSAASDNGQTSGTTGFDLTTQLGNLAGGIANYVSE